MFCRFTTSAKRKGVKSSGGATDLSFRSIKANLGYCKRKAYHYVPSRPTGCVTTANFLVLHGVPCIIQTQLFELQTKPQSGSYKNHASIKFWSDPCAILFQVGK